MPGHQILPSFQLILASQSPRRRELLNQAGLSHSVRPANIAEVRSPGEAGHDYVARLAKEKAFAVDIGPNEAILAADTIVVIPGPTEQILEKPKDREDALRMLALLSGRSHLVLTGICLRLPDSNWIHVESTAVRFAQISSCEMDWYVQSGEPFDKAGAYAIQGLASRFVESIAGCYFNVVGLPVHQVCRLLREAGLLKRKAPEDPAP